MQPSFSIIHFPDMAIGLIDESVENTDERERVTISFCTGQHARSRSLLLFIISSHYLLCLRCATLFLTHRSGLSYESLITQARNRCCFAREINSEVSDQSRMIAASVAYSFPTFYPSRA
jgi:hypothetical protein